MKRLLSLLVAFMIILSAVSASAEIVFEEFFFDSTNDIQKSEDVQLFEVDVQAELQKRLIEGWATLASEIDISDLNISRDDIAAMYAKVFFKNPYYYYLQRSFSGARKGEIMQSVKPKYTETDIEVVKSNWTLIDKAVEEILLYVSPNMTEFEKVMAVHDYMVNNYTYDANDYEQNMLIVIDKKGVCMAYSYAFIHVMNVLGIESYIVTSDNMEHAWNLVRVDGQWYHMDVTWDDISEHFAHNERTHALLSTSAIESEGHYGFDVSGFDVDSTLYDDEDRLSVYTKGMSYFIDGNSLVDENGNFICEKLDGGDGFWDIGGNLGFSKSIYAGLCELNGKVYYNTDAGIYAYDPDSKTTELILEKQGICGLYAENNIIRYNKYDMETKFFVESGSIKISDIKLAEPYYENGEAVIRLYNDSNLPLWVISKGDTYQIKKVTEKGVNTLTFDNGEEQTFFIWNNKLSPVVESVVVK